MMSLLDTVNILPNRNELSSGTYPGVKNTNSTPIAMPTDHTTAIAESSRTRMRFDMQSTPSDDATAKTPAMIIGFTPRKYPNPNPPKQAWVMPPDIATMRRVMMYVPIMAAAIDIIATPIKANLKN
jgi:hypothetical protein